MFIWRRWLQLLATPLSSARTHWSRSGVALLTPSRIIILFVCVYMRACTYITRYTILIGQQTCCNEPLTWNLSMNVWMFCFCWVTASNTQKFDCFPTNSVCVCVCVCVCIHACSHDYWGVGGGEIHWSDITVKCTSCLPWYCSSFRWCLSALCWSLRTSQHSCVQGGKPNVTQQQPLLLERLMNWSTCVSATAGVSSNSMSSRSDECTKSSPLKDLV